MSTFWIILSAATSGIFYLAIIVSPFYKKIHRFSRWLDQFMRDWEGDPEAPGRSRTPGVMERLNKLDGELSNNGGRSTKDTVDKLLQNQQDVIDVQQKMLEGFVEMGERLIAIENYITNKDISTEK